MVSSGDARDGLTDIERLRSQLEEQVLKLRKSIKYWQTVEADYEALKEEFQVLPTDSTTKDILNAGLGIGSDYINEKELRELTGVNINLTTSKTPRQVVDLVSKRIEYVHRNVDSIQKQLSAAEQKFDSVSSINNLSPVHEDGLPVREIIEELDENEQVVSGRVTDPTANAPEAVKALKKAGLEDDDFKEFPQDVEEPSLSEDLPSNEVEMRSSPKLSRKPSILKDAGETESVEKPRKKSVAFAEGSKPAAEPSKVKPKKGKPLHRPRQTYIEFPPRRPKFEAPMTISDLARGSFAPGEKVIELDEDDKPVAMLNSGQSFLNAPLQSSTSFPEFNEPSTDAATRRRLLEYSMQEMNHVVAELNLEEEEGDDWETGSEENAGWAADSDDENEDDYGLNRNSGISPEYRQQMMELQAKLEAGLVTNAGPNPQLEGLGAPSQAADSDSLGQNKHLEQRIKAPEIPSSANTGSTTVLLDTVVERQSSNTASAKQDDSKPKISRFKASRQQPLAGHHSSAQVAEDSPLAPNILERPPQYRVQSPTEPDELDPVLLQRELQGNYYEHRNRLIQKQGGFRQSQPITDEDGVTAEENDEVDENGKKISLFRRARLVGDPWAKDRVM